VNRRRCAEKRPAVPRPSRSSRALTETGVGRESRKPFTITKTVLPDRAEGRAPSPFDGEEQAKGEEKSNRNNPTFKNPRNPLETNQKTFSNRNKNTTSASPRFRPKPATTIHASELVSCPRSRIALSRGRLTQKTAGSVGCRPFGVLLHSSSSLPVSAAVRASTMRAASTVEAASAMEATATTNARVTSEAARRSACRSAASEAADGTASREATSREATSSHYCSATTTEPTIAGPTVEAATTVEARATVPAPVKPRARSDEDAVGEPTRAVVTVRRARVRVISIVTVLADRSFTDIAGADSNADRNSLCACERR
jgi:hypothetical protein